MAYDPDFYRMYAEYLKEVTVRASHNRAFNQFQRLARGDLQVVDFGCGLGEFWQYGAPARYIGVDVNDIEGLRGNFQLIQTDYHDLQGLSRMLRRGFTLPFLPNAFVSLFSVECFHSVQERYELYGEVFETFPTIKFGLVSGFFYESKRGQETVGETGGIVSHQTIEDPWLHSSGLFTELRMHIRTPSRMFGQDVVEVWKFFTRR